MSQEERKPAVTVEPLTPVKNVAPAHLPAPATPALIPPVPDTRPGGPSTLAKLTSAEVSNLYNKCKSCGAGTAEMCKASAAGQSLERFKCETFRKQMDWGPYGGYTAPSTPTAYSRPDPKKVILSQTVPDTGFPKIPQTELLARQDVKELLAMLGYMRPAKSATENAYIEKFIVPHGSKKDKFGNRWVWINNADGSTPEILFSSHTDTVHRKAGNQQVVVGDGRVWTDDGSCLGADDTVGNWLMIEMIKAKVPGCYVFHREEEVGGNGSAYIRRHRSEMMKKFKAAIAFDRKAYHSIITHQGGTRCCSETFSASLSAILGGSFKSDTGGSFTDTKNYIDLIGECTNLSVGYHAQHGPTEWQELSFAVGLKEKLIAADWSKLQFERKPGERESLTGRAYSWWGNDYDWSGLDDEPLARPGGKVTPIRSPTDRAKDDAKRAHAKRVNSMAKDYADYKAGQLEDLLTFTNVAPELVAHFLADKGFTAADMDAWYEVAVDAIPGAHYWDYIEGDDDLDDAVDEPVSQK